MQGSSDFDESGSRNLYTIDQETGHRRIHATASLGTRRDRAGKAIHRTRSRVGRAVEATNDALTGNEQVPLPIRPV